MRYAQITAYAQIADEKLIVIRYTTFYYHCPSVFYFSDRNGNLTNIFG